MGDEIGKLGHVVTRIRGGEFAGEVRIAIRGASEIYLAYCTEPVELTTPVLVIGSRGGRSLDVVPFLGA